MRSTSFFLNPAENKNRVINVTPIGFNMSRNHNGCLRSRDFRRSMQYYLIRVCEDEIDAIHQWHSYSFCGVSSLDWGVEIRYFANGGKPFSYKFPCREQYRYLLHDLKEELELQIRNLDGRIFNVDNKARRKKALRYIFESGLNAYLDMEMMRLE